jgi:hypothetical protein
MYRWTGGVDESRPEPAPLSQILAALALAGVVAFAFALVLLVVTVVR